MCTGLELIPLLASTAGAGISAYGQQQALKKQDQETARGIRANAEFGRQAGRRVSDEIQKTAASNPDADKAAATAEFMSALRKSKMQSGGSSFDTVGKVSDRFAEDVGAARTAADAEGAATAANLAAIDAPLRQRTREGVNFNNAATDLSLLANRAQGQDFLSRLRASMIRPKGQEVGSFLSGLGTSLAGRARPPVVNKPTILQQLPWQNPVTPGGGFGGGVFNG